MPFGKHRGKPVSELPDDYLEWLSDPARQLRGPLAGAVAAEVARRKGGILDDDDQDQQLQEQAQDAIPVPVGDPELKAAMLDLRDAVLALTRVSADLGLAMTRMSNTLDRIERRHFEAKPAGPHWTDAVPPTDAGAALAPGEPF